MGMEIISIIIFILERILSFTNRDFMECHLCFHSSTGDVSRFSQQSNQQNSDIWPTDGRRVLEKQQGFWDWNVCWIRIKCLEVMNISQWGDRKCQQLLRKGFGQLPSKNRHIFIGEWGVCIGIVSHSVTTKHRMFSSGLAFRVWMS